MTDLRYYRETLDIINRQLIERLAYRFSESPQWQALIRDEHHPALPDAVKAEYMTRFYQMIAEGLRSDTLRAQFVSVQPDSRAIRRILTGSDFPGAEGLTDRRFRLLQYVLNPEDANTRVLLQHRYRNVEAVGCYKVEHALPIRDRDREAALIARARSLCRDFGLPEILGDILYVNLLLPVAFEVEEAVAAH
jgi:chorismate mutase